MHPDQVDFRKKIYKSRYILAFLFTTAIFALGISAGMYFKQVRGESLAVDLVDQQLSHKDLLIRYQLIQEAISQKDCESLRAAYQLSLKELQKNMDIIVQYEDNNQINANEYIKLRHGYTLSQIEYLFLADQINKECSDVTPVIIYFFDEAKNCPDCQDQGRHLDYIKKKLQDDVLIFAFDGRESGVVDILKAKYNVTTYPSLVINESVFGFQTQQEILNNICAQLNKTDCS